MVEKSIKDLKAKLIEEEREREREKALLLPCRVLRGKPRARGYFYETPRTSWLPPRSILLP